MMTKRNTQANNNEPNPRQDKNHTNSTRAGSGSGSEGERTHPGIPVDIEQMMTEYSRSFRYLSAVLLGATGTAIATGAFNTVSMNTVALLILGGLGTITFNIESYVENAVTERVHALLLMVGTYVIGTMITLLTTTVVATIIWYLLVGVWILVYLPTMLKVYRNRDRVNLR